MDSQEKHGTIIHPDGKEDLFMFKGEVPRLKEIQKAIGGYIDVFYLSNGKIILNIPHGKPGASTSSLIRSTNASYESLVIKSLNFLSFMKKKILKSEDFI